MENFPVKRHRNSIGNCGLGWSLCHRSPLDCYACAQFQPSNEAKIHRALAEQLHDVVSGLPQDGSGMNMARQHMEGVMTAALEVAKVIDDWDKNGMRSR